MNILQILLLGAVLAPCILQDIRDYRIGNRWILVGWSSGIFFWIYTKGMQGGCYAVLSLLVTILIFFPFYLFHVLGAGDVKLLSVAGVICGFRELLLPVVLTFLWAALLSLVHMLREDIFLERLLYLKCYLRQIILGVRRGGQWTLPGVYYDRKRDGNCPVIHFSVAIGLGVLSYLLLVIWVRGGAG